MGIIRFLLASAVIFQHTGGTIGHHIVWAEVAVQMFFMISGFYMALVLNEKYVGAKSYGLFIRSRFLRLFPAYLIVLAVTVPLELCFAPNFAAEGNAGYAWSHSMVTLSPFTRVFLALTNILIIGQDAIMFLAISPKTGALSYTPNFRTTPAPAWTFLFVAPAWSLSVELLFYMVAPFLVRRNAKTLLAIVLLSLLLRAFLYVPLHFRNDPWTYRFFPTEIALFLIGALGYKAYRKLQMRSYQPGKWSRLMCAFSIFLVFIEPYLPHRETFGRTLVLTGFAIAIPFVFLHTKNNKRDRWIGELSYPLYITHYPIMILCFSHGYHSSLLVFSIAVAASILLLKFVDGPIDAWRHKWVRSRQMHEQEEISVP